MFDSPYDYLILLSAKIVTKIQTVRFNPEKGRRLRKRETWTASTMHSAV